MSNKAIITEDVVAKVANLIKINIDPKDLPNYAQQLDTVLSAADVLGELDTENVKPTSQTHGLENVLREDDEVETGLDMSQYKNTKNFDGKYFVVKKVL